MLSLDVFFSSFRLPMPVCHPPNVKQTVTDKTASSANSRMFCLSGLTLSSSTWFKVCFRRRKMRRTTKESQWRNENSGRELTSCQNMLGGEAGLLYRSNSLWRARRREGMGSGPPCWRYYYRLSRYTERRQTKSG